MQMVAFEPGSDVVLPPEREKLSRVADVLGKKPRLKLTVHGAWDAKADGEALRSRRVRVDVAQRLGVKLKDGEDPGPIALEQAKTQRALEALLNERAGAKAVDEFQASFEKSAGRKAERVNLVLAVVGRGSADRAFYDALFRKLVETTSLPDSEMTSLAQRRGEATARALRERATAAGDRVEVGDARAAERADKTAVPTRLELGVAS
jgi:ketosteroid isomerase-like protein